MSYDNFTHGGCKVERPEPRSAFHGKTCGECAWILIDPDNGIYCRKNGLPMKTWDTPACPAFVAKGDE